MAAGSDPNATACCGGRRSQIIPADYSIDEISVEQVCEAAQNLLQQYPADPAAASFSRGTLNSLMISLVTLRQYRCAIANRVTVQHALTGRARKLDGNSLFTL